MAIYRCNKCGFICEDHLAAQGAQVPCGKCGTTSTFFLAVFYVRQLVARYLAACRELEVLKQGEVNPEQEVPLPSAAAPAPIETALLNDLQNTKVLATAAQHKPLQDWFLSKQITANFDFSLVDTTGFFDEAAKGIGDQYHLLAASIEQIRYAYRKDFAWVNLDLSKKNPEDARVINAFFRGLYSHTFFSRYEYQKNKKVVGLAIQPATVIRSFFAGTWLEWYAFIIILNSCVERSRAFSCARSVKIEFRDDESRELDVAFLIDGRDPIFIECKSGEFRSDIAKHVKFRRRLGVDRTRYLILSTELTAEEAVGLTAMYDLTFVNLDSLKNHVKSLI